MLKVIGHIGFITLFLLITFFGIGPVVFADGTNKEKLITLIFVVLVYGIWIWLYRVFIRKMGIK